MTAMPFTPRLSETPTFATARRCAPQVMQKLEQASLLVWCLMANDEVHCIKFNRNRSWKRLQGFTLPWKKHYGFSLVTQPSG